MPAPILALTDLPARLPPRGALIGLDLGAKTIGVATSDPDRRIATGVGTSRYGAQLLVEADSRADAIAQATETFLAAAAAAGLPEAPVVRTEAISEAEDEDSGGTHR